MDKGAPTKSSDDARLAARKSSTTKPATKSFKVPTVIVTSSPFCDTLALLALFSCLPAPISIFIHGLYITLFFSSTGIPRKSARAVFGWYSTYQPNSSQISSQPSTSWLGWLCGRKAIWIILKAAMIDIVLSAVSLYLIPSGNEVTSTLAHSVVSSSLSGGSSVFPNAIYSTTLIHAFRLSWLKLFALPSESFSIKERPYPDLYGPAFRNWGVQPLSPLPENHSYNTLSSIYSLIRNLGYYCRSMDWRREIPALLCQAVAIHVIAIGLSAYLRRVFPGKQSLETNTNRIVIEDTEAPVSGSADTTISGQRSPTSNKYHSSLSQTPSLETSSIHASSHVSLTGKTDDEPGRTVISMPYTKSNDDGQYTEAYSDLDFLLNVPTKRNKKLAIVRSNQPLWSMLASSIVLAARQESTNISQEEEEEQAAESKGIGKCYVRYILESVIAFHMTTVNTLSQNDFVVNINGISWPQVTVERFDRLSDYEEPRTAFDESGREKIDYLIVIYGLTPITQYVIDVLYKNDDGAFLCCNANICTAARQSAGNNTHQAPARPLSPVTMLLDNLATMQMTLSEEKSRLKRSKKEHYKRLASLRAEIDMIRTKIDTADKGDERNKRKILSLRESIRQVEKDVARLQAMIEELNEQFRECEERFAEDEITYNQIMTQLKEIEAEENRLREARRTEAQGLEEELNILIGKRDKLLAKRDRILNDIDRLDNEWMTQLDEESSHRKEKRAKKLARRKKLEEEFADAISKMEKAVQTLNIRMTRQ